MNHKDFIKNYLPGLTRGVYAVRLLLKVAPTYIAALSIPKAASMQPITAAST